MSNDCACDDCDTCHDAPAAALAPAPKRLSRRWLLRALGALVTLISSRAWAKSVAVPPEQVEALKKVGSSAIVKVEGISVLVVRDEPNGVHAVNAKCTHKGCTVHYNAATKQINCKCHKSVYELATGANVSGPSKRPLTVIPAKLDASGIQLELPDA